MNDKSHVGVGIGCFVWRDGKFLVQKRQGSHGNGTWGIPGGALEFGESFEQCAVREVMEETGMHIKNPQILAVTNDVFSDKHKHDVGIWITSEWESGEPYIVEPTKCAQIAWRDFTDLPSPLFEPCWQNLQRAKPELFE